MKRRGFLQFLGVGAAAPVIAAAAPRVEQVIAKATEPFVPPATTAPKIRGVIVRAMTSNVCFSAFSSAGDYERIKDDLAAYSDEDDDA